MRERVHRRVNLDLTVNRAGLGSYAPAEPVVQARLGFAIRTCILARICIEGNKEEDEDEEGEEEEEEEEEEKNEIKRRVWDADWEF